MLLVCSMMCLLGNGPVLTRAVPAGDCAVLGTAPDVLAKKHHRAMAAGEQQHALLVASHCIAQREM